MPDMAFFRKTEELRVSHCLPDYAFDELVIPKQNALLLTLIRVYFMGGIAPL